MRRQMLESVGGPSVEAVVGRLAAVQAHADLAVELSVGLRRAGPRYGDVAAAVADGRLIKVFAFRGARHLVTPEAGATYLRLRAASRQWELRSWQTYYGLKPSDWPSFRAAVRDALADGPRSLTQLGTALVADSRYRHLHAIFRHNPWTLIKALMWQGDMCFSPSADGQPTFQRLDANPSWPGLPDLDDAGPRAIEAYFSAYGPATAVHLHYWLGQGLSAGRKRITIWLASLGDRLAEVKVDGESAFVLRQDVDELLSSRASTAVRLLPAHDQWVLGPGTADAHILPPAHRALVSRTANIALVGGAVRGTWSLRGRRIDFDWFAPAGQPPRRELESEVRRIGAILGHDLELA
jgi:hypothetical protein